MVSGCASQDLSGHFTVSGSAAPFYVKADRTVNAGYSDTICI